MNSCPFCNFELLEATFVHEYNHWNLFLQSADKRRRTKRADGFLALKQHAELPTEIEDTAWKEVKVIIPDSVRRLCQAANMTYLGSETVGFNQGADAGQTVNHAHIHILPATEEDPIELRQRGGIGGAFEELRKNRTRS